MMPLEITAALIVLAAAVIYAVARLVQKIPIWIAKYVDARLSKHDLEASKINAEAMRDRALADAYISAASAVAQCLTVIQILASNARDVNVDRDMLQRVLLELEKNSRLLNALNERLKDDTDNESSSSGAGVIGDAG